MTALTIISNAAVKLGLTKPTTIGTGADPNVPLLLQLANQEGDELSRRHDWQNLIVTRDFVTSGTEDQAAALPANDYDRLIYNCDIWDRSRNLKLVGPTPSRVWADLHAGLSGGVTGWWRILGDRLHIWPVQPVGLTYSLEYVSKNWAISDGGDLQASFLVDADKARIPERLIELGVVWRWRSAKGFTYAEEMATYEREVEKATSRDRGTGVVRPPSPGLDEELPPYPAWTGQIVIS